MYFLKKKAKSQKIYLFYYSYNWFNMQRPF